MADLGLQEAIAWLFSMDSLFLIGTAAFTVSGYIIGAKKRLDWLGILIVALLTSIGGGVLRDVMLNRIPLIFFNDGPVWAITLMLVICRLANIHKHYTPAMHRLFIVCDSIGLVAFSLAGAQLGIHYGLNAFGVLFVSFVSAVGGGIVRDMMVNELPFILHKDVYGTVSILVAGLLYFARSLHFDGQAVVWLLFVLGLALRLYAHLRSLRLPRL